MNPTLIELLAAMAGLCGALLLALNGRRAGWGFALFTLSNLGWMAFAVLQGHWGLLAQNVGFMATSLLGCWVWLVRPWLTEWRNERWDRQFEREIAAGAKAWREAGEEKP